MQMYFGIDRCDTKVCNDYIGYYKVQIIIEEYRDRRGKMINSYWKYTLVVKTIKFVYFDRNSRTTLIFFLLKKRNPSTT